MESQQKYTKTTQNSQENQQIINYDDVNQLLNQAMTNLDHASAGNYHGEVLRSGRVEIAIIIHPGEDEECSDPIT